MTASTQRFRQRDLTRLLKAAADAGLVVVRVEVDQTGKVALYTDPGSNEPSATELDKWLASRARAS